MEDEKKRGYLGIGKLKHGNGIAKGGVLKTVKSENGERHAKDVDVEKWRDPAYRSKIM